MPLSPPVARKLMHTREIRCTGHRREDGLWDIEGCIIDTKTYGFSNHHRGTVDAGEPVHEMWVRLTIDENMVVHEAEASTEASPFAMCGDVTPRVAELKGLRIARGWTRKVRKILGKTLGCTHITQLLLGPLATTAFQTIRLHPHPH